MRTEAVRSGTRILQGIPGVKSCVAARRFPYDPSQLPAIDLGIVTEQTSTTKAGLRGQRMLTRVMTLRVRIVAAEVAKDGDPGPEERLTAIQLEVERRMAANQTLATEAGEPVVRKVELIRTDTAETAKGAQCVVATGLFFQLTGSHREGRPDEPSNLDLGG